MNIRKMVAMAFLALCVSACSDDENEEPVVNLAQEVAGTYSGYTVADCNYFHDDIALNQSITVTAKTEERVDVALTSDTWGKFTVTDASVTLSGDTYCIKGRGTTEMGMHGSVKEYDCTLEATVKDGKQEPVFLFSVPGVMGGLTVQFLEGDAPVVSVVHYDPTAVACTSTH